MSETGPGSPPTQPELILLGSGQDGGVPQLGRDRHSGTERSAASAALVDGRRALLIDASPDLRRQQRSLLEIPWYSMADGAGPFDAVLLTHGHMGHYTGLVQFGREAADVHGLACLGTGSMKRFLSSNEPWRTLLEENLEFTVVEPGDSVAPWPGIEIRPVAVPHRGEFTDTVAWSITVVASGSRLLYLPDIDGWDAWPEAEATIAAHDVCVLDGTFFDGHELGPSRAQEVPHPPVIDTVARFRHLTSRSRIVLSHLNRTNPLAVLRPDAMAQVTEAGFEVGFDGMRILDPNHEEDPR